VISPVYFKILTALRESTVRIFLLTLPNKNAIIQTMKTIDFEQSDIYFEQLDLHEQIKEIVDDYFHDLPNPFNTENSSMT